MNVLAVLDKELKNKNLTLEEKVRYIYLRSCQLFTYDDRYDLCEREVYKIEKLEEIKDKFIDLENMIDNRIICTTYARQVLPTLIKELLNIECISNGTAHIYNYINIDNRTILADPTISSDLSRVKMGLSTYGYKPIDRDHNFDNKLEQIDKKIGYIENEYENNCLEKRISCLYEEFIKETDSKKIDDFIIYKIYAIKELFEKYQLNSFSDSEYCISYLINKFFSKDGKLNFTELFEEIDEDTIKRINIYPINLKFETLYFILQEIDSEMSFYEISKNDAKQYVKSLNGINKKII